MIITCGRAAWKRLSTSGSRYAQIESAARMPGVDTVLMTDRTQLGRVRDLVIAGNTAQLADPAFVAELKHWIRFNPRAALESGDGLYGGASGNPIRTAAGARHWRGANPRIARRH